MPYYCKLKPVFQNLITFPTSSSEDYTQFMLKSCIVLMAIPEADYQYPKWDTYTVFLKFEF